MSEQALPDRDRETDGRILEASSLSVSYGQVSALRDVNLTVREGEIASIIGPNGAGKTTFADTVAGHLPYDGSITYDGREVADVKRSTLVERGMIYCTEKRDLFPFMDVEENLRLGAYRSRDSLEENLEFVYDVFPKLEERRDQEARTMSGGEQQMLALGRGLMGDPELLILDEPTIGLAPVIIDDISDAFEPILDRGVTVLLTEQNATFALNHADTIHLLENGRVVKSGAADEMKGDDYIRETYLGG
ncbi:ABC transporter related protein (plasmid) [Haloterrigena turkmenica DSM 5511]|uniref:ABC transporter related protein n=1 Tax=Haloterrigena turkmenica (strain ATCC 51198 / DSM 5511 / JCM 9101 / NCIMB 13204 / VKM B-1734 / 4k) TaxID=543526 RepID=D2RZW9_HALTV|nr:ABC transporter ATP-binding protein [Haloterrigena turkmenica]ADB62666.1 ABC transporter related protein [Haloterrigena turkmenica DSM 5511]